MWVWVVIGIIAFVLFRFFSSLNTDKKELRREPLNVKFSYLSNRLNDLVFNGRGDIQIIQERELNIYDGSNQIINILYSTGNVEIIWRFKYYQKEIKLSKVFADTRNISSIRQIKIAEDFVTEMYPQIVLHKNRVLNGE